MAAHGLHAAALATRSVLPRWATLKHAHVAEREVVLHRIVSVEAPQRGGDLLGRAQGQAPGGAEAEVARELVDVGVDGNEKERWADLTPNAEVDAIGRAHHPAQEEPETLARGWSARIAQEVRQALLSGAT